MQKTNKRIKIEGSDKPVIDWESILQILDEQFALGADDISACKIAGISKSSFYEWQKRNEWYLDRKNALKNMPNYQARLNITKAINKGDVKISQWYLERKDDEFKPKQGIDQTVTNTVPQIVVKSEEHKKEIEEREDF